MVLLFMLGCAVAYDPYENEAPLGPETGCAVHRLAYEYATTELLPNLLPEVKNPHTHRAVQL